MQEAAQRLNHLGGVGVGLVQNLLELVLGLIAPMPRILEGRDLRLGGVALGCLEQQVVIALAVEGRIEIDQIDALVRDVLAQNSEVVAEEEGVRGDGFGWHGSVLKTTDAFVILMQTQPRLG